VAGGWAAVMPADLCGLRLADTRLLSLRTRRQAIALARLKTGGAQAEDYIYTCAQGSACLRGVRIVAAWNAA